jgi:putative ABC transport system permease protein
VRQVLTEALLLSGFGAVLGAALAYTAVRYFRTADPIELNVGANVEVNWPVLAFSATLGIATAVIFGLLPALRASRVDLIQHLKTAGRGAVRGGHGLAKTAIAIEMAFSFLLLIGAGLLMTSALRMGSAALGFNPKRVVAARVPLPASRYATDADRLVVYDRLLERLERMPGVSGAALGSKIPPDSGGNQVLEVQGRPAPAGSELHEVGADAVSPRFFEVLDVPLRRGRLFDGRDRAHSQPVVIINEALARKYFANADPLGQHIRIPEGSMPWLAVVGVVGNLKSTRLMNEMSWEESPIFYRPLAQEPRQSMQVAARVAGDPSAAGLEIQRQIAAVDSAIPLTEVELLTERLAKILAYPRFRAVVLVFFAIGALVLSAVGLHGVLSQLVAQRMQEFGLRRAVGAQTRDLLLLVARQGGLPVFAGLAGGLAAALAFGHVLANLLYGIDPAEPAALAAVSLALLAVAGVAILLPARRAARVDPMVALRDE